MNLNQLKKELFKDLSLIGKIRWIYWDLELKLLDYLKKKWD